MVETLIPPPISAVSPMENFSYSSYPDSGNSSPHSREIDDTQSWDEPPANYKVKFMCSYGGRIQPRPHDNQLSYIGGDTKILAVDRNIKFSGLMNKLSSLCDADVCFKYQLPGEDLDALISVTNDEDLDHMMLEFDRLCRASSKPARLRLFLFSLNPTVATTFGSNEPKSERQWFVDALNSVQIQTLEVSSPPSAAAADSAANPDFLFGLDKGFGTGPATKFQDTAPPPTVPEVASKDVSAGSDCGSEDRHVIGEPVGSPSEIQRQIQELQRLQIAAGCEQGTLPRKSNEGNPMAYPGDYFAQRAPEKISHAPAPMPIQMQMPTPATYFSERQMTTGGYHMAAAATATEQPVYLIHGPAGVYQATAFRPMTGPASQAYYGVQRVMPEMYREQPVYNAVPATASLPQPKVGAYGEGIGMVQPKAGVAEQGYVQVGYDGAGRQVFYTTAGGLVPPYQAVAPVPVEGRQGGGGSTMNQESKVVNPKGPQTSSV